MTNHNTATDLQDALKEVLTFPEPIIPGFATLDLKKEVHDSTGNTIPAKLHFMNERGFIYVSSIVEKTGTGFRGELIRYNTPSGDAFTFYDLVRLILADEALAPFINQSSVEAALGVRDPDQLSIFGDTDKSITLKEAIIQTTEKVFFGEIRQGTATNALTKIRPTNRNTTIDVITGAATIKQGEMTVTFPSFETVSGLKTSTYKLLDAITEVFTAGGSASPVVRLDLKDYMEKCGLKDRKEARKQAVADLETLRTAAISFKGKRRGADTGYYKMNISGGVGISSRGVMTFTFSDQFFNLIRDYPKMPYPNLLYRLNGKKNPNSYYLLRKIAEHKHMNVGKKNEDTISVKTLLSAAAFIPSYSTVSKSDRHYDTRIIAPFERDMDALSEALKWEYCNANHAPLTDEELATLDYDTFSKLLVHIIWEQYPNQTARLERRAERLKAAQNKQPRKKGKAEGKGG